MLRQLLTGQWANVERRQPINGRNCAHRMWGKLRGNTEIRFNRQYPADHLWRYTIRFVGTVESGCVQLEEPSAPFQRFVRKQSKSCRQKWISFPFSLRRIRFLMLRRGRIMNFET